MKGAKGYARYTEYIMVKTFGALVYSLPWEKVQMFMDCIDIENRIAKIEADTPPKKKPQTLHR